jgi:hypothetical protein
LQAIFCLAKSSGYENGVAGPGSCSQDGSASLALSDDSYIDEDFVPPCGVTPRERTLHGSRGGTQRQQEFLKPRADTGFRQSQAQQKTSRLAAEGRDVADCAGQRFVSNHLRRMAIWQKVRSLQRPVARKDRFVSWPWPPECRIIADSSK